MKRILVALMCLFSSFSPAAGKTAVATFAGGCFWCMESELQEVKGVISVVSGFTGGKTSAPTYEAVSTGTTGHREAVEVTYDPAKVSYEKLLEVYWDNINPADAGGQFADRGDQYRTAIFYHDAEQKRLAEASKEKISKSKRFEGPVVTEILPATKFYAAGESHQDYYKKHPLSYKLYRVGSGRDSFVKSHRPDSSRPH